MKKQLVWDIPVRLFHWLLVACLIGQWLTAEVLEDTLHIHFYIGYFTLGLIIFRLVWGFIGTKYAKFSSFIKGPKAVLAYAQGLISGQKSFATGHNPLGGLILPAVLLLVGLQAVTGLFTTDDVVNSGPYYASAYGAIQAWMQWLHHKIIYVLIGLVVIHLLAIAWYQWALKHNLTVSMLTGCKKVDASQGIASSKLIRALILAILVGIFVFWLVEINPPEIEEYYY